MKVANILPQAEALPFSKSLPSRQVCIGYHMYVLYHGQMGRFENRPIVDHLGTCVVGHATAVFRHIARGTPPTSTHLLRRQSHAVHIPACIDEFREKILDLRAVVLF